MSGYLKAGLCLVLALVLIAGGYTVERWRAERHKAEREGEIAKAVARGAESNLRKVIAAQARADWLQAKLAAAEAERDQLTQEKNDAIRRLTTGRRCLDSAAVRVLNQPLRPGLNAGPVPEAAGQPVPADAAFATDTDVGIWANGARRAYDTCRGRLQAIADFFEETPMTDDIDRAQAREEELRSDALADFERRHRPTAETSAEQCKSCGETIPEGRRQALPGVQTCVECQRDIEAQGRWDWGMGEC